MDNLNKVQKMQSANGVRRITYIKRKACIMKKTMELATLCGIDVCTIIIGPDGEFDTWPEDPDVAMAIIKNFKECSIKRIKIQDDHGNIKKVVPGRKAGYGPRICKNVRDCRSVGQRGKPIWDEAERIMQTVRVSDRAEFLKELDSKIEDMTEKIQILRKVEECKGEQRRRPFMFDLNQPPPDEGDEYYQQNNG